VLAIIEVTAGGVSGWVGGGAWNDGGICAIFQYFKQFHWGEFIEFFVIFAFFYKLEYLL